MVEASVWESSANNVRLRRSRQYLLEARSSSQRTGTLARHQFDFK